MLWCTETGWWRLLKVMVKNLIPCLGNALTCSGEIKDNELLQLFQRVALGFSLCDYLGYVLPLWKELYGCSYLERHWSAKAWWWTVCSLPAGRGGADHSVLPDCQEVPKESCCLRVVLAVANNISSKLLEVASQSIQMHSAWVWVLDKICFLRYVNLTSFWSYVNFCGLSRFVTAEALICKLAMFMQHGWNQLSLSIIVWECGSRGCGDQKG